MLRERGKLRANPLLDLHHVANGAEVFHAFEEDDFHRDIPSLFHEIGQERQVTRAFDRLRQEALLLGRNRRDAGRNDFALLRDVALEKFHVLVVDRRSIGARERADLAPAAERAARRQVGDVDFLTCAMCVAPSRDQDGGRGADDRRSRGGGGRHGGDGRRHHGSRRRRNHRRRRSRHGRVCDRHGPCGR